MPASSAALAITAVNMGSIASVMAERERDEECLRTIQNYDSHTATVQQMQDYSSCVNRMHPHPIDPSLAIVLKGVIVVSFILAGLFTFRYVDGYNRNPFELAGCFLITWFGAGVMLSGAAIALLFLFS